MITTTIIISIRLKPAVSAARFLMCQFILFTAVSWTWFAPLTFEVFQVTVIVTRARFVSGSLGVIVVWRVKRVPSDGSVPIWIGFVGSAMPAAAPRMAGPLGGAATA